MARKLGLSAGVSLGIGMILYSLGDMILIGDSVAQTGNVGVTEYVAISLFALFIFLLLGASVIRRALAYNGQRLRGRGLMSTTVIGSLYLIVQGAALISYGNKLGGSTPVTVLVNNGILLIASGILIIASGALLLQSGQSPRIAGGVISLVAAALLTDLISAQAAITSGHYLLSSLTNIPSTLTTSILIFVTKSSTVASPGYFLAIYWAEEAAIILGAIGLLAWAILYKRSEAKYAAAVSVVALLIYGIGLAIYGFQTSISIFNGLSSLPSGTGFISRLPSESQLLAWSLLIVGIGGILTLIASGFGIGLTIAGVGGPVITRQQTVLVPASATGGAFCRKCGAQARLGDTHCRSCGASLT